jgi:Xaa-Pro aminopeptidase
LLAIVATLVAVSAITPAPAAQAPHAAAIAASEYQARRATLAKAIGPDGVFIAFSFEPARRTGDVDWPFRQEDNLLYLTGMNVPETTLVMLPGERDRQELLFASDRDPLNERWTGKIASREDVTALTGVRDVLSPRRFAAFTDALFQGGSFSAGRVTNGAYAPPAMPAYLAAVRAGRAEVWLLLADRSSPAHQTREQQFADELRKRYPEIRFRDASPLVLGMRETKSAAELALIQRAVDVTVEAQKAAMARVKTATRENQVQATVEFTFRNLGACCWAFPSIVAAGRNATTLHYETNNDPIVRDGLLLTDLGAEVEGYSADVTRTYPADGTFSAEQRAIYDIVFAAQNESMPLMRPGHKFVDAHTAAAGVIGRELLKLGLVTKNVPEQVSLYFFHSVGHQLGLQTHDAFDRTRAFAPGMVVTNEPGVYVRKDDVLSSEVFVKLPASEQESIRAALSRYDGIGVRIEDDMLITEGEPKMLSAGAPRSPKEIEALMAMTAMTAR